MSEHVGGKGSGASSSSEFLRAYRVGVIAGANASYSTIPKKVGKTYATSKDLLEAQNQRGVLEDLSSVVITKSLCTIHIPGQYEPLKFVTTNLITSIPAGQGSIAYINTGNLYVTNTTNNVYSIGRSPGSVATPLTNIANLSYAYGITQSHIDNTVYIVNYGNGSVLKSSGIGVSYLVSPSLTLAGMQTIAQDSLRGTVYVTKSSGLQKVTTAGVSVSFGGTTNYTGIAYATNDNLYGITSAGLYQINITTGASSQLYSNTNLTGGIIQANDGYLYVTSVQYGGSVIQVNLTGSATPFAAGLASYPQSITQDRDEYLYVSCQNGNIYQIVVA
jgi:hypothetical protein